MKRLVLLFVAIALSAGSAFAQAPDSAYVGIFADAAHTVRQVNYGGGPAPTIFTAYIWWLPSVRGVNGAEFAVKFPSTGLIVGTVTPNSGLTVQLGTLQGGISIAWDPANCQTTWTWSHTVACYLTSADLAQIEIANHPTTVPPHYVVATCELGFPIEPVIRFTHLYLNWDGGIATEAKSWGAIKSMF